MNIYTITQFMQSPGLVMEQIRSEGSPALITSQGAPQFMITPFAPGELESKAGAALLELGLLGGEDEGEGIPSSEVDRALGLQQHYSPGR